MRSGNNQDRASASSCSGESETHRAAGGAAAGRLIRRAY